MRRLIACMSVAAMLFCMTACTDKTSPGDIAGEPSGATLDVQLSHSYKSERLDLDGCQILENFGDKLLLFRYTEDELHKIYILYDPESGSTVEKELDGECSVCGAAMTGDTIELFYQVWSEEEKKSHSYILTCDSQLNTISEEEVSDLWREAEAPSPKWGIDTLMPLVWVKDAEGNEYLGGNEGLWVKTTDNVLHQVQGVGGCANLFFDQKGRLYSVYFSQAVKLIDTHNLTAENISLPNLPQNSDQYAPGNSTYDFTYSDDISVYGVKLDEGIAEELMNWEDSDFSGNRASYRMLEDGRMLVTSYSTNIDTLCYLVSARTQEEADAIALISMVFPFDTGLANDDYLTEMAHQFNREHDGYKIAIRSYDPDNAGNGWEMLEADLLAGIVPDIIVGDGSGFNNYEAFSNMGLFEDLRPWMENDPEFRKEDYLYNLFEALAYKGRMEQIAFTFSVTSYLARSEYLGEKQQLTMDDLSQLLQEDRLLFYGARRTVADSGIFSNCAGAYIDYETGTCRFDSPEFVQFLELCGTLPETAPIEDEDAYRNDNILLYNSYALGPQAYHNAIETFGTEDIAIAGIPFIGDKGNGGMFRTNCPLVVSSQSQYKELIWEFIKYCLREDNQKTMYHMYFYTPVNLAALKENFQEECQKEPHTYTINDVPFTEYPPAPEEADKILAVYKNIAYAQSSNRHISDIVREEASMYLSGDCTAQEAAGRIQGRVSLYLSEQQ